MASPLFNLPLPIELRALIFEELFLERTEAPKDDNLYFYSPVKIYAACFHEGTQRKKEERVRAVLNPKALPIGLITCTVFFEEGLKVLSHHGRIHIGNLCSNSDVKPFTAERAYLDHGVYFIGEYPYLANQGYDEKEHNCEKWHDSDKFPGVLARLAPCRLVAEFAAVSASSFPLVDLLNNWLHEEVCMCRDLFRQICEVKGVREMKFIFNSEVTGHTPEWTVDFENMGFLLQGMRGELDRLEISIVLSENNVVASERIILAGEETLCDNLKMRTGRCGIWRAAPRTRSS